MENLNSEQIKGLMVTLAEMTNSVAEIGVKASDFLDMAASEEGALRIAIDSYIGVCRTYNEKPLILDTVKDLMLENIKLRDLVYEYQF